MKKRGSSYQFYLVLLIVSIVFIKNIPIVIAAGNTAFNESDFNTWLNDIEKFKAMNPETKAKVWKDPLITNEQKVDFIKSYLKKLYPNSDIEIEGFDIKGLGWGGGGNFGSADTFLDLADLPKDVKKISFSKPGDKILLTVQYKDGSKIILDKGVLTEKNHVVINGEDGKQQIFNWNGIGEFSNINGEIKIKDGATFSHNGHIVNIFTKDKKGEVTIKLDSDGNFEIIGAAKVDTLTASVYRTTSLTEPFKVYFDKRDLAGETGSYARIVGNDILTVRGKDLEVKQTSYFDSVDISGDNLVYWNGNSKIAFKDGKVLLPRNFESFENDINSLKLGKMTAGESFMVSNGKVYFRDAQGNRMLVGSTLVTLGRWGRIDLAGIESTISQEDLNKIKSKIKREDFNSDEEYQRAIDNEINLGRADWSLSVSPTGRPIVGRIVAREGNKELSGSDLADSITLAYDTLDQSTANLMNDQIRQQLENPENKEAAEALKNDPRVQMFVSSLGISQDMTVSKEQTKTARLFVTQNAELVYPYLPDRMPIPDEARQKFGITAKEAPKDVVMSILTLSNNQETYEQMGSFIENSRFTVGGGITMGVYGKKMAVIENPQGEQFVADPRILNSMRTVLLYTAPELLYGNNWFTRREFMSYTGNKAYQINNQVNQYQQ
ncbi:MAG: hypothetical protein WC867_03990 [Candidatus Pacearchaeota archaeon]|jgi:hypothetical protein